MISFLATYSSLNRVLSQCHSNVPFAVNLFPCIKNFKTRDILELLYPNYFETEISYCSRQQNASNGVTGTF